MRHCVHIQVYSDMMARENVHMLNVFCWFVVAFGITRGNVCPPNYELRPLLQGCYRFYYQSESWFDARDTCEEDSADLVVINTGSEKRWLEDKKERFGTSHNTREVWIGLNNHNAENEWKWVDDSHLNISVIPWSSGHPASQTKEIEQDCVVIGSNGLLYDVDCSEENVFICEQRGECGSGWAVRSNSCYLFSSYKATRRTAAITCRQYGSHLIVLDTTDEVNWIKQKVNSNLAAADVKWWIGLDDIENERRFKWIDGTSPYKNILTWATGEPNHKEIDVTCGAVSYTSNYFQIHTQSCREGKPFICEKLPFISVLVDKQPLMMQNIELATCVPLEYDDVSINASCVHGITNERVPCNESSLPSGSYAELQCSRFYTHVNEALQIRTCLNNGQWSDGLQEFACELMCGRTSDTTDLSAPFITFGEAARQEDWPWHVAIFYRYPNGMWNYFCGATLVSLRAVITAAHCVTYPRTVQAIDKAYMRIHLGKINSTYYEVTDRTQEPTIENVYIHEEFNPKNLTNDIAIIRFREDIEFTRYVRPICRPGNDEISGQFKFEAGVSGVVVGWGKDENDVPSTQLRMAQLRLPENFTCIKKDESAGNKDEELTTFCAGGEQGINVCSGDSGSGWISNVGDGDSRPTWVLHGIVSKGQRFKNKHRNMCNYNVSTVFTRVDAYMDWIESKLNT